MSEQGRHDGEGPARPADPHDDPFGEHYVPELSVVYAARAQISKYIEDGGVALRDAVATAATVLNPVAQTAREVAQGCLSDLERLGDEIERLLAQGLALADSGASWKDTVDAAVDVYAQASPLGALLLNQVPLLLDPSPHEEPVDPFPEAMPVADVRGRTKADLDQWIAKSRTTQGGQLLVLAPSAGSGKSYLMINAALEEAKSRRKVLYAVLTKEFLKTELLNEMEKAQDQKVIERHPWIDPNDKRGISAHDYGRVKLHIITGRDQESCFKWENVQAVQNHGYPAGSAVCPSCEHHPSDAQFTGTKICPYYESRKAAQLDSEVARRTKSPMPVIMTTHAALLSARNSGAGLFGKFWGAHTIMVDEDPTAAFEPSVVLTEKHLQYEDKSGRYTDLSIAAEVMREAILLARRQRDDALASGLPTSIHHPKYGSAYAGRPLKELLAVVARAVGEKHHLRGEPMEIFRNAADKVVSIASGSLFGQESEADINRIVPPSTLAVMSEMICDEYDFEDAIRAMIAAAIYPRGHKRRGEVKMPSDLAYQVRLEYVTPVPGEGGGWRFVGQDFSVFYKKETEASEELKEKLTGKKTAPSAPMPDSQTEVMPTEPNIILADAYAHTLHYRQLFNKPAPKRGVDPVTVVRYVAHYPKDSLILRIRVNASMRYYDEGGWQESVPLIAEIAANFPGKRVLWYGHDALRERFLSLMEDNDWFGCSADSAFEHFWGGRGKNQYKDFNAIVTLSDPIQNLGAQLHICNARAFRDARSMLRDPSPHPAEVAEVATRVRLSDTRHGAEHAIRAENAHWRMQIEHERQNMGELMQALARVRGIYEPKTHVVLGEVEFTRDILTSTAVLHGEGLGVRAEDNLAVGYLTEHEIQEAILAVMSQIGVWSPAFDHAFLSMAMRTFVHGQAKSLDGEQVFSDFSSRGGDGVKRIRIDNTGPTSPGQNSHPDLSTAKEDPSAEDSDKVAVGLRQARLRGEWLGQIPSLIDRIFNPPPFWELANETERQRHGRVRVAQEALFSRKDLFPDHKAQLMYRPVWFDALGRTGPGYRFFSKLQHNQARRLFAEIIDDRYGPTIDGKVQAPRRFDRLPF